MRFGMKGLEAYRTNPTQEAEVGAKLLFPGGRWIRVLRAGGSNERYRRALEKAVRPYKYLLSQDKQLPREVNDSVMHGVYAATVVIDWGGFTDEQGSDIPFSEEAAIALFQALPELFSDVAALANRVATFQEQEVEEAMESLGET